MMKVSRLLHVKLGLKLAAAVAAAEAKAPQTASVTFGPPMTARHLPQGMPDGQHRLRHIQQQSAGIASFMSNRTDSEELSNVVPKEVSRTWGKHSSFLHFSSSTHQKTPHKNAPASLHHCDDNEAINPIKELSQKKAPLRIAIGRTRREGRIITLSSDRAEISGTERKVDAMRNSSERERTDSESAVCADSCSPPPLIRTAHRPNVSLCEVEDLISNVLMRRATRGHKFDSTSKLAKEDRNNSGVKDSVSGNGVLLLQTVFPSAKYIGLVACGVSSAALVDALGGTLSAGKGAAAIEDHLSSADFHIGVNFAVHRLVNASPRFPSSSSSPTLTFSSSVQASSFSSSSVMIEGLLKGCAEQNALGAFAARGLEPFTAVRTVVLFGRHIEIDRGNKVNTNEDHGDDRSVVTENCSSCCCVESTRSNKSEPMIAHTATTFPTVTAWWVSMFPCGQCWSHLCEIWRAQRVSASSANSNGSSVPLSTSALLTLVISIDSMEEVNLLRHTLSLVVNNNQRRGNAELPGDEEKVGASGRAAGQTRQTGEAASSSCKINVSSANFLGISSSSASDRDVKAQWFIKRHTHLLPALMRPSTCVIHTKCGGGQKAHVKEQLFMMPSTVQGVLRRDTTSFLMRKGGKYCCQENEEDDYGPRIILIVQRSEDSSQFPSALTKNKK